MYWHIRVTKYHYSYERRLGRKASGRSFTKPSVRSKLSLILAYLLTLPSTPATCHRLHATPHELSFLLMYSLSCLCQGRELTFINAWVTCLVVSKSIYGLNLVKKCISITFIRVVSTFIGGWCSPTYFSSFF